MIIHEIYELPILKYGEAAQRLVAIEEMSELTKELCKWDRGMGDVDSISEEIADVTIMLMQLIIMFECEELVMDWMDFKTTRLLERILNE